MIINTSNKTNKNQKPLPASANAWKECPEEGSRTEPTIRWQTMSGITGQLACTVPAGETVDSQLASKKYKYLVLDERVEPLEAGIDVVHDPQRVLKKKNHFRTGSINTEIPFQG